MQTQVICSGSIEIVSIGNGLFYSIENKNTGKSVFLQEELDVSAFRIAMETVPFDKVWEYCSFDDIAESAEYV